MKKNIFLKILLAIILIILLIFAIIGLAFISKEIMIVDKNYEVVYGKKHKKLLQDDGVYIFYPNKNKEVMTIEVNDDEIKKVRTNKKVFKIVPTLGPNFNVEINDSIKIDKPAYTSKSNIFAVSDIEGNFSVFSQFLINNKIIDKNLNWIFKDGHLVCNGDFFDRGNDVTACLWLIYKLEQEAEKQGGKVHFIIGNHEEMNIRGFVKFVHPKYLELVKRLNIPYKELYNKDSELGRWLRHKNSITKINDVLFTHGGISVDLANRKYSLAEINSITQEYVGVDKDYLKMLNDRASFIFSRKGPMWYRGYFGDYKKYYKGTSQKDIDNILNYYEANHIVVGHTIVDKVQTLFKNKIIAIDVMYENDPRREDDSNLAVSCEGLYIENNKFYRVLFNGKKELLFKK